MPSNKDKATRFPLGPAAQGLEWAGFLLSLRGGRGSEGRKDGVVARTLAIAR